MKKTPTIFKRNPKKANRRQGASASKKLLAQETEKVTSSLVVVSKDDECTEYVSKHRIDTPSGYSENDLSILINTDGSVSIAKSDPEEGFIYLYPDQVKHLKKCTNYI